MFCRACVEMDRETEADMDFEDKFGSQSGGLIEEWSETPLRSDRKRLKVRRAV